MSKSNPSNIRKLVFCVLAFPLAFFIVFITGEILARYLWKPYGYFRDERNLCYRYDEELGWFPISNSLKQYQGCRLITAEHNKDGFRDKNHVVKNKKRIAFLGDSFVWGYDVEQNERFTDKLQTLLSDCEIMNMGVSGYGTDQEFILLQKWFKRYQPDVVVVVFNENDWDDNNDKYVYNGYYKPYFDLTAGKLVLQGVPVRKSLNYYCLQYPFLLKSHLLQGLIKTYEKVSSPRRNISNDVTFEIIKKMKSYAEFRGAKFKLVFAFNFDYDRKLSICKSLGIDYLFLGDNEMLIPCGGHWSARGNDSVCSKIYPFLVKE